MTDLLTIKNLGNTYGQHQIFAGVNLQLEPGRFISLVGQSGGGKSTLLRLIAGLEKATTGDITIEQEPVKGANPKVRMMFQDDRLLPWLTVLENLSFGSHNRLSKARAKKLLDRVQLSDYANMYPAQLSGGQRQRIALARALMASPKILLLDEPLGALDALTRAKMQELIAEVVEEENLATILVTHDVTEAVKMSDQIIVVRDGNFDYRKSGLRDSHDATAIAQVADEIQHYILEGSA